MIGSRFSSLAAGRDSFGCGSPGTVWPADGDVSAAAGAAGSEGSGFFGRRPRRRGARGSDAGCSAGFAPNPLGRPLLFFAGASAGGGVASSVAVCGSLVEKSGSGGSGAGSGGFTAGCLSVTDSVDGSGNGTSASGAGDGEGVDVGGSVCLLATWASSGRA